MTHSARAARALAHLAERDPALSVLALWCDHRDGDATRTDGARITYGPDFPGLTLAEQIGLAGHHVLHVALRHGARQTALRDRLGAGFDADLYGLVTDALVNEALLLAGHGLPRPAVTVTELLRAVDLPARAPVSALSDWDADRLYMRLARDDRRMAQAREYGNRRGWAADLGPDTSGGEDDRDHVDWQGQIARALETGRRAGTGIGALGTILAELAPPRVPWERELRGLLARALTVAPRQSWRRPAGRWVAMEAQARAEGTPIPVFQPQRQMLGHRPRLAVGIDTSGSIDTLTLRLFAAEAASAARRTGAETHLLAFDTEVHLETRLSPGDWDAQLAALPMRRGGGTGFAEVIARAGRLQPSIAVILTDLDGPLPGAPAFPVVWAVPGAATPPYGRVLQLDSATP